RAAPVISATLFFNLMSISVMHGGESGHARLLLDAFPHSPHSCACHRNPADARLRGERVLPAQRLGLTGFL
ncbi:hypothetical protein, partial [Agrobacterium sp.]|uniref:hypothetical protein n=1 Tax=Agrobacterium sp. TaxID=361 RepID=UPI0025C5B0C7